VLGGYGDGCERKEGYNNGLPSDVAQSVRLRNTAQANSLRYIIA
jgi:hypothetical protein